MSSRRKKEKKEESEHIVRIPIDKIEPPEILLHPVPDIAELEELAISIKEQGLIEPIVVRPKGDRYQVVVGYRRFLACKKFGIGEVPARIMNLDDKGALLSTAVENIQRTDIDVIEEGKLYYELITEHGYSRDEIAKKLGKSLHYINSRIDLLDMPEEVQELARTKKLKLGIVPYLKKIETPEEKVLVASDLAHKGYTIESAKYIIDSFLKYKKEMQEAPKEEVLKKAEETPLAKCDWCTEEKPTTDFRAIGMCDDCYRYLVFLHYKAEREKRD